MVAYSRPITLEAALKEVTRERFCKGHHYKDVALTDEMVEQIVQVKSLVNMGFINTAITDEALKIVLQVPRLKSLSLKRTRVTFEGLMAVEHYSKVSFYLDKPFTAEQIKAFEQAKRTAGKKKLAATPTDDLPIVKQLLLDFFAAMTEWEAFATKNDDTEEGDLLVREKCKALFQKYCIDKRRAGYRPEGIHFSLNEGGTYRAHQIIDSELVTKNKIYLYTQDRQIVSFAFSSSEKTASGELTNANGTMGGWSKYGL